MRMTFKSLTYVSEFYVRYYRSFEMVTMNILKFQVL